MNAKSGFKNYNTGTNHSKWLGDGPPSLIIILFAASLHPFADR